MFVALHHAQSLPEESVLGLDILGIRFATTREQSLSELCLAAVASGSQAFTRQWPSPCGTVLGGTQVSLVSVRSSQAGLALQQDRN